ncbi:Crp/Fnr family transcriptional regulator [Breoghania sp. L-A4]|uniref:Crp/Fnr family transcriptional regulator n=1 Tax=Breoghania sp. L-A4 TaxID=2304600 RepID=UPI000E359FB3|nr:Crp/Fnr family transcriptional regulator [Breoghania sp. L-A4]AXS39359.1 Crp/Fnr family transcriptional regulator [Breoghania sp. L-A4]
MAKSISPPAKGTLRAIRIFYELPEEALDMLESKCRWSTYDAGDEIVPYLDDRDDVYFLLKGKARVMIYSVSGKVVGFRDIEPGHPFGEYAAIDKLPRSARVEAREPMLVARLSANDFWTVMRSQPRVMEAMMVHLVAQVRLLTARVFEFSTLAVNNRIQAELLRLAGNPEPGSGPAMISPCPKHAEIAVLVSTHREAVTREISRLAKMGVIERLEGHNLRIRDVDRLVQMVQDATGE